MGYMFETEIDAIINTVRAMTIGEQESIELRHLLTARIHPAIKAYFRAEIGRQLNAERSKELRSRRFPYAHPEVVSLQQQIDLLLMQHYPFTQSEFDALLDEAVHFEFNYLCRPQWTLLNFVIGDQRRVSASSIEKRLKYCVDYTYFPELVQRYMIDHGLAEVTYEEFKSLIERIDSAVIDQHSSLELAHMTRALFDFVESGKMVPQTEFEQQTLPINAAIVFYEDKHLNDIRVRLEFERDHNRILQLTIERLADIIEIVRTGNEEASAQQSDESMDSSGEEQSAQREILPAPVQTEPSNEPGKPIVLVFGGDHDEQYLPSTPGTKQKEILDLFTKDERKNIITKLFDNDEPGFLAATMEMSLMESWDEVALHLDTIFIANEADPFCKEAVVFTDKLFAHFHPDAHTQ